MIVIVEERLRGLSNQMTHHVNHIEEFGGRALRVVFDPNLIHPRVVTVDFDCSVKNSS
jgi:hypothetical protein